MLLLSVTNKGLMLGIGVTLPSLLISWIHLLSKRTAFTIHFHFCPYQPNCEKSEHLPHNSSYAILFQSHQQCQVAQATYVYVLKGFLEYPQIGGCAFILEILALSRFLPQLFYISKNRNQGQTSRNKIHLFPSIEEIKIN